MNHPGPSEELLKLLENLPPDEPRSKLEPFRAVILRWRRQGRSYRRIQEILLEQCKVDVAYETLRRFVQRRERPRAPQPEVEAVAPTAPPPATVQMDSQNPRPTLHSFRAKPALPPKPAVLQEFHYNPDLPLTLDPSIKD